MTDSSVPWSPRAIGLNQQNHLRVIFLEGCLSGDVQQCSALAINKEARVESTVNRK